MLAANPLRFLQPQTSRPDAPLFVFLPGMDGTGQLLRTQTEGLESRFEVRCLSIPPDDLTSWEDLTEQTIALIKAEMRHENERTVYLCGESFGACLAIKVALHSPHLFRRVILVNPASSFHRYPWVQWSTQMTRLLPEPLYRAGCVAFMPFLASLGQVESADRRALLKAMLSVTQESSVWRLSLLSQFHITPAQLQRITQPVLIIASQDDRVLPSRVEAELLTRELPNARMHLLPNSGHACLLESGVNLYQILERCSFLEPAIAAIS
ncbi:alpha/beta hydrolase [Microcoleus sp. FACHB-1515]|uniref:alpha/beta fold hydrolase n=1 Tax=Cyanophyceae TaxID=3028117 RepID=UPI0016864079|nr:alpha/beta hydrolase [Microcoleus sp. FACHB-1515]MBD2089670.1 alpha/beta hydrolase [Microcoleus sp. FACHB-1515]